MISTEVRALFDRLHAEERRVAFPFVLPGRNQLDEAQRRKVKTPFGWTTEYAQLKRKHGEDCALVAHRFRGKWEPFAGKAIVACNWREPDRHRDPDNIVSGGRKLLLDALGPGRKGPRGWNGAGLLHCDGWHCIAGFLDLITLDAATPGITVVVAPIQLALPLSMGARFVTVDRR